jgi:hypothetical protein
VGGYVAARALDRDSTSSRSSVASTRASEVRSRIENPTASKREPTVSARPSPATDSASRSFFTMADRASFRNLERDLGGASGLAVSAVGLEQPIHLMGTLREDVAWSTIKVPIALAIETRTEGRPSTSEQSLLARAITASDNAAAETLWGSLGTPTAAAAAVETVLAKTGDTSTHVETRVLRPGFTSFGQTRWSLAEQQRFIAGLPCLPHAEPVLSLMRHVVPEQRWGLGSLGASAQFKGGWGPRPRGGYLVRQMGIVRLVNGRPIATSIATVPSDGSFETGTANVTQMSRWLLNHIDTPKVPSSKCGA